MVSWFLEKFILFLNFSHFEKLVLQYVQIMTFFFSMRKVHCCIASQPGLKWLQKWLLCVRSRDHNRKFDVIIRPLFCQDVTS